MAESYEFWIEGVMSRELLDSFHPVESRQEGGLTMFVLSVRDEPELFGVVARCETLGLKILRMEQLR